jgi:hypothetical protein
MTDVDSSSEALYAQICLCRWTALEDYRLVVERDFALQDPESYAGGRATHARQVKE